MISKKIILPTKRYAKSPEEELFTRIDLTQEQNILRENDKNISIDVAELYNKERNLSNRYNIYGKIRVVFDNPYYGTVEYEYLKNNLYLLGFGQVGDNLGYLPYNEFAFLRNDLLRQYNTHESGDELINFTPNINVTEDFSQHTKITPISAPYQNWNVYLSYVYTGLTNQQLTYTLSGDTSYTFTSSDGIPFIVSSDDTYYILTSPVEHGMNQGEYVILSGGTFTNVVEEKNRIFKIQSVGDEKYRSDKFVINILKTEFKVTTPFNNGNVVLGKRCINNKDINNTKSTYYVHKHKILTNSNDYLLDKLGFESSIWEDEKKLLYENAAGVNDFLVEKNRMENVLYSFKKPFILSGLTNNLGYTPTEVYTTIVFRNGNGYFDYPPKVGYSFNFHDTWIDNHFDGNDSLETNLTYSTFTKTQNNTSFQFKSGITLNISDELIGAYVEYNPMELKERIISDAYHKIVHPINIFDHNQDDPNEFSGSSVTNTFGIYYKPHNKVKLRELSPYVEISNTKDIINLPENAKYYENEKLWKWRDLYDHGFIDTEGFGTDFPFINGMHYILNNINFYIKNEKNYTNKKDEIKDFDKIDC